MIRIWLDLLHMIDVAYIWFTVAFVIYPDDCMLSSL